jgi:hypothetical protein
MMIHSEFSEDISYSFPMDTLARHIFINFSFTVPDTMYHCHDSSYTSILTHLNHRKLRNDGDTEYFARNEAE